MSSFSESHDYSSQLGSIPIDDGTASSTVSHDIPVDEDDGLYNEGSFTRSTTASRSQATPSRSGVTGASDLYGSSAGEGISGSVDEDREYSSGYDSLSFSGYESTRSPLSGSEMSSTFASFYYENEFLGRVRHTISFFRRPLYFAVFAVGGSGVMGSVFRAVRLLTRIHVESDLGRRPPFPTGPPKPAGYPDLPAWLQEVRASLPVAVVKPAEWTLRWHGVPILSEVQRASQAAVQQRVSDGLEAAKAAWRLSGPVVPIGLFLPLFTFIVLRISSKVLAKKHDAPDFLVGDNGVVTFIGEGDGDRLRSLVETVKDLRSTLPAQVEEEADVTSGVGPPKDAQKNTSLEVDEESPPPTARLPPRGERGPSGVPLLPSMDRGAASSEEETQLSSQGR